MKRSGSRARARVKVKVKVSADGRGVVSHAGTALLRELAQETGLAVAVTGALIDTYRRFPLRLPGQVFTDLAVAIADGVDAVSGIEVLRDQLALLARSRACRRRGGCWTAAMRCTLCGCGRRGKRVLLQNRAGSCGSTSTLAALPVIYTATIKDPGNTP